MALLVGGFFLVQRLGLFGGLARISSRLPGSQHWESLVGEAAALDDAVLCLYRNRRSLAAAGLWRLGAWLVGTGEVWLALYFLGAPRSMTDALLLESLGQAVRALAFMIPGALGVQEGGYLLLGGLLGLGPELALAVSLAKRVREVVLGVPGLIAWQIAEGRHLWRRRRRNP
jgi:putative membrane protein